MTPHSYPSIFPFPMDLNEDQQQQLFTYHYHAAPEAASSSTSQSCHNFIDTTLERARCYYSESLPLQHEKADMSNSPGGSCDHASATVNNENCDVLRLSLAKKEGNNNQENKSEAVPFKWMSSKMRLMRKMTMMRPNQVALDKPDESIQKFEDHNEQSSLLRIDNSSLQDSLNSSNNSIRVCADCNTTKTPLWRSGPRGPKSLCNACGIRQRKARRAAMAAAAAAAGANASTFFVANTRTMKNKAQHKEGKISNKHLPFKKRCNFTTGRGGTSKKLCVEDLKIILNNNHSAFQRVFPQDEKEAAILLMHLSHGLVHG